MKRMVRWLKVTWSALMVAIKRLWYALGKSAASEVPPGMPLPPPPDMSAYMPPSVPPAEKVGAPFKVGDCVLISDVVNGLFRRTPGRIRAVQADTLAVKIGCGQTIFVLASTVFLADDKMASVIIQACPALGPTPKE